MKFNGIVSLFDENALYWEMHIPIPNPVFEAMNTVATQKRVICTLNNSYTFHCAMMPKGTFHYILLNKEICKKLKLNAGDDITVDLKKDDSRYGMNITEEMTEVLLSDPEGSDFFHRLSPGKQRTLIHLVNKIKSSQLRIEKSFIILEHLKNQQGELNFKQLNEDFKNNRFKIS